jgi:hypothetical protein
MTDITGMPGILKAFYRDEVASGIFSIPIEVIVIDFQL